jgi:putative transposase
MRQWPAAQVSHSDVRVHQGLTIDVDGRIRSPHVIDVLSHLVSARGAPAFLRSDDGPEFVSTALLSWIIAQGIGTALIEPGKPWQNGVAESFNGKFRDECLSLEWFRSRAEAKAVIEAWRRHYNEVCPHSSLGISRRTSSRFGRRTQRPVKQRAGALRYVGLRALARCTNRSERSTFRKQGTPSQGSRGPKKRGRS